MKKENLETADFEFRNNFERIRFPHFLLFCHRARPKHFDNHMAKILEYHWSPRKKLSNPTFANFGPFGSKNFFFDPTDGMNHLIERNFTGHGNIWQVCRGC